MDPYQPSTPRAAVGLIAAAMTTITVGAMVVLPAKLSPIGADPVAVASAAASARALIEVAISPARIDIIVVREPNVAWATDAARPNCKPEG